jgi:hypothetical protein
VFESTFCRKVFYGTDEKPMIDKLTQIYKHAGTGRAASSLFKNSFNIDRDIDFITDDNPAAVHCILPADSKVLTIDLTGRQKPARVLGPLSTPSSHQGVSNCPR